jgi:hypothetical protein
MSESDQSRFSSLYYKKQHFSVFYKFYRFSTRLRFPVISTKFQGFHFINSGIETSIISFN